MEEPILARIIIEMMGAPKEHLEETLRKFVEKVRKNHEVVSEDLAEPKPHEKLFTNFVELEMRFKKIEDLLNFCFEAMPSSIEILEPVSMKLDAGELSGYLNDMQERLHTLDMSLKNLKSEQQVLQTNAEALFKNLIILSLKQGPKKLTDLSRDAGIDEKHIKPLLKSLLDKKLIKEDDGTYSR
jgi:hypothetical protein